MQNNTFSTLFVGQNLIRLSEVDSTNNFLKTMVSKSEPLPEGTVIMADNQFAGRGQQNNIWHAGPGLNLTFSIYLKPSFLPVNKQFLLNIALSLGIINALKTYVNEGFKIKWPNDIYYNDRKLGGVLIENSITGSIYKSSVVGIGLNVNQQKFNPEQVRSAVSLREILQQDVNLLDLLAEICSHIERQYLRLKGKHYADLAADYRNDLYRFEQNALYRQQDGKIFEGRITEVTDTGKLVLLRDGITVQYNFKEIEFLNG